MNFRQAVYIRTIAEEGGITAAAQKLYISQPTLSRALRMVEEELGVTIFERVPFRPTYAGERCLHACTVILNTMEILRNELEEIRQEDSGRLRLGISRQRAAVLLPVVMPRFTELFPRVEVELEEQGSATLVQLLQEGSLDLAFASTNPTEGDLHYELLEEEVIGILAGAGSELARTLKPGTSIGLDQVRCSSFICLKEGHNIRVIQDLLFREYGMAPEVYLETDSMETALQVTLTSDACMLCPHVYVPRGSIFFPLKAHKNLRHYYACTRRDQRKPKYARAFQDLVQEALAGMEYPWKGSRTPGLPESGV